MRFLCQRQGNALVPVTQDGREEVNRIEHGQTVSVSVTGRIRNMRQHRLWWTVVGVLADDRGMTKEDMKEELCEKIGHVRPRFYSDGSMTLVPKSIAVGNMPADKFEDFFNRSINAASAMLGSAPQDLIDHINEMLDPMRAA